MQRFETNENKLKFTRATHAIFLVCTWSRCWRIVVVFASQKKVIPYHPCVTAPCLTHSCLRTSLRRFVCQSFAVVPVDESIHRPSGRRLMLWPTADQSPLTEGLVKGTDMDLSGQNHGNTSNTLCSSGRQLLGDVTPAKAFGTYDEAVDRPELVWLRCWILLGHSGASAVSGNIWIEVDNAIESVARLECLKCRSFFLVSGAGCHASRHEA